MQIESVEREQAPCRLELAVANDDEVAKAEEEVREVVVAALEGELDRESLETALPRDAAPAARSR